MSSRTFAELYCERHALRPEQYADAVLRRSLYPHARLFAPVIRALSPDYFTADRDLVVGAGGLRRMRDFTVEVQDFVHHPANQGDMRKLLRLRVSTQRLARLVRETLHPDGHPGTEPPFRHGGSAPPL